MRSPKSSTTFKAAVALHYAYYNFVKSHIAIRCTPAMAAGVENSAWTVGDLVARVESVSERIEKLKKAVELTEHGRAEHVESRVILEGFAEAPIWEGVVETFQLRDHPKAKRAYAWLRGPTHSPLEKSEEEYTIVLGIPPVISPETAVRAAIMAQVKKSEIS